MRIILLFLGLCLALCESTIGQKLQNQVLGSAAGSFNNGINSIDWTLGQPLTARYTNGTSLTVGFLQNLEEKTSSTKEEDIDQWISIYPSPTTDIVHLNVTNDQLDFRMQLLSSDGKVIRRLPSIKGGQKTIDLSHLVNGIYFIHLINQTNTITYKIIKANA